MEKIISGIQEAQNLLDAWKKFMEAVRVCDEKDAEVNYEDILLPCKNGLYIRAFVSKEDILESWHKAKHSAKAAFDKAKEAYDKLPLEIRTELSESAWKDYCYANNKYHEAESIFRSAIDLRTGEVKKGPWHRSRAVIELEKALPAYIEAKIKYELFKIGEA